MMMIMFIAGNVYCSVCSMCSSLDGLSFPLFLQLCLSQFRLIKGMLLKGFCNYALFWVPHVEALPVNQSMEQIPFGHCNLATLVIITCGCAT